MTTQIRAKLAEIRERMETATAAPWERTGECDLDGELFTDVQTAGKRKKTERNGMMIISRCYGPDQEPNADFIAHSRTDIPALLKACEELLNCLDFHEGSCVTAEGQRTSARYAIARAAEALGVGREG